MYSSGAAYATSCAPIISGIKIYFVIHVDSEPDGWTDAGGEHQSCARATLRRWGGPATRMPAVERAVKTGACMGAAVGELQACMM